MFSGCPFIRQRSLVVLALVPIAAAAALACSSADEPVTGATVVAPDTLQSTNTDQQTPAAAEGETATAEPPGAAPASAEQAAPAPASAEQAAPAPVGGAYLTFNQAIIEGLASDGIRLDDPDSVFAHVFGRLPDEVMVYPSENYYYFILYVAGRQVWGNIRLPAGQREEGILSFGYFEFIEFPVTTPRGITGSSFYGPADGVLVREIDRSTYSVTFEGKMVTFRFHELDQTPPRTLPLGLGERFIQRTFDESGYQFYLLFNELADYFIWVLNEEEPVPDLLEAQGDDLVIGRRSGFAFWVDPMGRKVLTGVRQLNIRRNDYYDGPFDQLADNYAEETQISAWMQRAFPGLRGRIDTYGYYTDQERPLRVALSTYYAYAATSHIVSFIELLDDQEDPYAFISRGGRPPAGATTGSVTQETGAAPEAAE
jgi:hypothetical protein